MTYLKRRVASHKILRFLQNNKVIFFFQKKSVQSDHWRLLKKKIAKIEGVASLNLKNKRDRREIQPLILSYLASQGGVTPLLNFPKRNPYPEDRGLQTISSRLEVESSQTFHGGKFSCLDKNKISQPSVLQSSPLDSNEMGVFGAFDNVKCEKPQEKFVGTELHSKDESLVKMAEQLCGLLYGPNLILGCDSLRKLAHLSSQLKEDSNLIFTGGWYGNQLINHLDSLKLLEIPQDIWKDGLACLSSSYARPYLFLHSLIEKRKNLLASLLKEKMYALVRSLQERKAQQAKEE